MEIKLLASLLIKLIIEYVTGRQVGFLSLVSRIRQLYTQSQAAMNSCDSSHQGISPPNLGYEGAEFIVLFPQATYFQERDKRKEVGWAFPVILFKVRNLRKSLSLPPRRTSDRPEYCRSRTLSIREETTGTGRKLLVLSVPNIHSSLLY